MPINGPNAQIIEIVDRQSWIGQEVINRYWYRLDSLATTSASAIEAAFDPLVVQLVVNFQSNQLTHLDTTVINHTDPFVFGVFPTGNIGARTPTDLSPPFQAVGVRLNRTSRDMRNGQKRYAGLSDDIQGDGIFTAPFLALVATNVAGVASSLIIGAQTFVPVVVRNRPTQNDPLIDPLDTATWRYTAIASLAVKNAVTTQNSRKF